LSTSTLGAWTGSNADATGITGSEATYTWGGAAKRSATAAAARIAAV
jgi:hypothetical protein